MKNKHQLQTLIMDKSEFLEMVDAIDKNINATVLPSINELIKTTSDSDVLVSTIAFSSLKEKKDSSFFKRLYNVISKYRDTLPSLKSKIEEYMPDTITTTSNDVNVRLVLSLVSEGVFFSETTPVMLSYLISKYYTKSSTELDPSTVRQMGQRLSITVKIIPELEKADLKPIIEAIGNVPTIKSLKFESTSTIPSEVVLGFFKDTFSIKNFYTLTTIKRLLGYFNIKDYKNKQDIAKGFIGNPIMHLRLLFVDLTALRLEAMKDKRKLLELRLLELRSFNNDGSTNPKLSKQIAFYEDKLNKLDMKIDKLSRI